MINKIIIEYLRKNKRLVVPELGAFIRKEEANVIVFVPFLKKDDGVLEQQLVADYSLTRAEAREVIEEYTLNAKTGLASKGAFIIERLGTLKTDANGIFYLDYNPEQTVEQIKEQTPRQGTEQIPERASGQTAEHASVQSRKEQPSGSTPVIPLVSAVSPRPAAQEASLSAELSSASRNVESSVASHVRQADPTGKRPVEPLIPLAQGRPGAAAGNPVPLVTADNNCPAPQPGKTTGERQGRIVDERSKKAMDERSGIITSERLVNVSSPRPEKVADTRPEVQRHAPSPAHAPSPVNRQAESAAPARSGKIAEERPDAFPKPPASTPAPKPRPAGQRYNRPKQQRADLVMIVAILAALVAITAIIFGFLVNSNDSHKVNLAPATEQVADPSAQTAPATTPATTPETAPTAAPQKTP